MRVDYRRQVIRGGTRRATAVVELSLVLPYLCFICLASVDYARLIYSLETITNCARDGALYAADPSFASTTSYTTASQAALADATDLSPQPTVSAQTTGTDAYGYGYVEMTVSYTFSTIMVYPGIPSSVALSRKVRMMVAPTS